MRPWPHPHRRRLHRMAQETARGIVSLADPQATSFVMTSTGTKAKWHIWEEGRPWLACGQDYDPEADEIAVSSSSHPSSALCGTCQRKAHKIGLISIASPSPEALAEALGDTERARESRSPLSASVGSGQPAERLSMICSIPDGQDPGDEEEEPLRHRASGVLVSEMPPDARVARWA